MNPTHSPTNQPLIYDPLVNKIIEAQTPMEFFQIDDPSAQVLSQLMIAGFMIMSYQVNSEDFLIAKIHQQRMAVDPSLIQPGKTVRKKLPHYTLTMDVCFDQVVDNCITQHGGDWLTPTLIDRLNEIRVNYLENPSTLGPWPVSFELWSGDVLVAGEFGILCGNCYTSYSGFTKVSGSGTVQLYALASFLAHHRVGLWDLGMAIGYKIRLGAKLMDREEFIQEFRKARQMESDVIKRDC
jgi:Leu/Phe-tRNA-protein transferase